MKYPLVVNHRTFGRSLRLPGAALVLAWLAECWQPQKAAAQNRIEYRYEDYQEDAGRMHVRTHSAFFETELDPKFVVRGQAVYDGISGATPTGGLPSPGTSQVPLVDIHPDLRHAYNIETAIKTGLLTTTPQVSYSTEHDYHSWGLSLNESIDLNRKNTTLNFGFSRNLDHVAGTSTGYQFLGKNTWDALVGVTQILDAKTYLTVNFTLGSEHGYLNDPYRVISVFDPRVPDYLGGDPSFTDIENRPGSRLKETVYIGITHFFDRLDASADLNYRFHDDDWGILGNTIQLTWNQKIGSHLTLSPMFRYHRQTAADFYMPSVKGLAQANAGAKYITDAAGNPASIPFQDITYVPAAGEVATTIAPYPTYFSSDYRLASLQTFTFGLSLHWQIQKHLSVDAAYQRYEMQGLDGVTPASNFPTANVLSAGLGIQW